MKEERVVVVGGRDEEEVCAVGTTLPARSGAIDFWCRAQAQASLRL